MRITLPETSLITFSSSSFENMLRSWPGCTKATSVLAALISSVTCLIMREDLMSLTCGQLPARSSEHYWSSQLTEQHTVHKFQMHPYKMAGVLFHKFLLIKVQIQSDEKQYLCLYFFSKLRSWIRHSLGQRILCFCFSEYFSFHIHFWKTILWNFLEVRWIDHLTGSWTPLFLTKS